MEGKKCDKTIDFAIKWWTDILSGKERARSFYEEMKDDLEEIKEEHEEAYTFLSQVMEQLDAEMEEERSEVYLNTEQVRRFEEQLRVQIKKSIEKDGYVFIDLSEEMKDAGEEAYKEIAATLLLENSFRKLIFMIEGTQI